MSSANQTEPEQGQEPGVQTSAAVTSPAGPSTRSGAASSTLLPFVDEPEQLLHQTGLSQSYQSAPVEETPQPAGMAQEQSTSTQPPPPGPNSEQEATASQPVRLEPASGTGRRHSLPGSAIQHAQLAEAVPNTVVETFSHTGASAGRGTHIAAPATMPVPRSVIPIGPVVPQGTASISTAMRALAQNVRPEQRAQFLEALELAGFRSPDSVVVEAVLSTTVPKVSGTSQTVDGNEAPARTQGTIPVQGSRLQSLPSADPSLLFPAHERSARAGTSTAAGTRSDDRRASPSTHGSAHAPSAPPPQGPTESHSPSSLETLDFISQVLSSTPFERTCTAIARTVASEIISNPETSEVITANLFGSASFLRQLRAVVNESVTNFQDQLSSARSQRRSSDSHDLDFPSGAKARRRSPSPHDSDFPSVSEVAGPSSVSSHRTASERRSHHKDYDSKSDSSSSSDTAVDKTYVKADISDLKPLRPTNELYTEACDFNSYRLQNQNARYTAKDRKRMNRFRKDMIIQMRPHVFDGKSPIAVMNFLSEFVEACDVNEVHEGAARWLFQFYIVGTAKEQFKRHAHGKKKGAKMVKLTTYCAVVQYFLRTYATDEVIARAHEEVSLFKQGSLKEEEFSQQLLDRAAKCGNVYPDSVLRSYFAEGVSHSIRQSVRQYLSNSPDCDLMQLAQYAASQGDIARSYLKDDSRRGGKRNSDVAVVSTPSTGQGNRRDRGNRRGSQGGGQQSQRSAGSSTASIATRTTASPPAPANAVFAVQGPVSAPSMTTNSYTTSTSGAAPSQPSGSGSEKQPCRICLSFDHDQSQCPHVAVHQRQELSKVREANYERLRDMGYYTRNRSRSPTRPSAQGPHNRHPYSTKNGNGNPRQDPRLGQSKN